MNGDSARAGLKQIIAERNQADLGADGLGRLIVSAPTTTLGERRGRRGFAFWLQARRRDLDADGARPVTPSGPPTISTVDLGAGNPVDGDTIQYRFTLPDGSSESITLTATTSTSPGPDQFTIGATSDVTATNLQAALTASIGKLAAASLSAASAVAASNDFFNINATHPPQRVAGPPFDSATAQVAGTAADTVSWYTGELGTDPARANATARVDPSITVSYGIRANEQGIRWIVQNVAVLAAVTFSPE